MKWAYDLTGAEPIIKDEPIYDAATIAYGELVMLGATAFSAGADAGVSFVTASKQKRRLVGTTAASLPIFRLIFSTCIFFWPAGSEAVAISTICSAIPSSCIH